MIGRKRGTPAQRERRDAGIVAAARDGAQIGVIAAASGLSRIQVRKILARAGVPPRHCTEPQPERDAQIAEAVRRGVRQAEICRELGISKQRVSQIVRDQTWRELQ